jgi:hypothetical protein
MRLTHSTLLLAFLGLTLLAPASLFADPIVVGQTIKLQETDNNNNNIPRVNGGGPFRADLPGTIDDFLTFCLERNEQVQLNVDLTVVSITDEARRGGVSGAPLGGTGDPISGTTAFIYSRFREGVAFYSNAQVVQHAIWLLEAESDNPDSPAVTAMLAQAVLDMAALGWGVNELGGVQVLNLLLSGALHQDVLTYEPPVPPPPGPPIPEPATMLLLGTGLLAAALRFRRAR